ncbi:hypothetical protein OTU49_012327 [Cherax quadricarinatus]|uniref:C2H2-type domain-containing protein n=1 Tax=Cherax quadricarinatus TaxID=27406 RepID=A0AAW0YGT5_CHEQU
MGFRRTYDLHRHMLSHAAVRPFQCPHCTYRASLKYNLDAHVRLKHPVGARPHPQEWDRESLGNVIGGTSAPIAQPQFQQMDHQQSCESSDGGSNFIEVE